MPRIQRLILSSGQTVEFPLYDVTLNAPAIFILSIRKSGSTLLSNAMEGICECLRKPIVDIGGTLFHANIPLDVLHKDVQINKLLAPGLVYYGFRDYPSIMEKSDIFRNGKKVVLVRDPRDALVSEYFSNAYSHSVPATNTDGCDANKRHIESLRQQALTTDINAYVVDRARAFLETAGYFFEIMHDESVLRMKYENVVFNKHSMIKDICDHCDLAVDEASIDKIVNRINIIPSSENPRAFIRQVSPGDHKRKLSTETIAELNRILHDVIAVFGYSE